MSDDNNNDPKSTKQLEIDAIQERLEEAAQVPNNSLSSLKRTLFGPMAARLKAEDVTDPAAQIARAIQIAKDHPASQMDEAERKAWREAVKPARVRGDAWKKLTPEQKLHFANTGEMPPTPAKLPDEYKGLTPVQRLAVWNDKQWEAQKKKK
jgi:hypothetical protein